MNFEDNLNLNEKQFWRIEKSTRQKTVSFKYLLQEEWMSMGLHFWRNHHNQNSD